MSELFFDGTLYSI